MPPRARSPDRALFSSPPTRGCAAYAADAEPDTLRYRLWHLPAKLVRHARHRILKIRPNWPWREAFLTCWQRLTVLPAPT